MGVTVTDQTTVIDACNDAAPVNWNVHAISGAPGVLSSLDATDEEQPPFEGTYCYGFDLDIENGGHYKSFGAIDYSAKIIYFAACVWTAANLEVMAPGGGAQAGVYIIARDSAGNYGYWHVAGSDTYKGGWRVFVASLARAPDTNSGTAPNLVNCDGVGIGFNHKAKSKAAHNCFIDLLREADIGDGLKIVTDAASVASLADVVAGDGTELIREAGGVYFTKAPFVCGDTAAGDMEFKETGEILIFEDLDVPAGHYGITVQGNAAGTIKFQSGNKTAGGRGIQGLQIIGNKPFHFTATDSDIDELKIYGTAFVNFSNIYQPPNAAGREFIDCTYLEGVEVDHDTCVNKYCTFINADDGGTGSGASKIDSASHNVSYCTYLNCPNGWHVPSSLTLACAGNMFSGCTYDVENSGDDADVVINASAGSNIATHEETGSGTPTTVINNPKYFTLTNLKAGSDVKIIKQSDRSVLGGTDNSGTSFEYEYNYAGDIPIWFAVIHANWLPTYFEADTLVDSDKTIKLFWFPDRTKV